jgi:hypothetical protein
VTVNRPVSFRSFRWRLMAAMMLVVGLLTFAGLYFAQGKALASAEAEHHREFRAALAALNAAQATRADHLAERCRTLVGNPRIHAALEDDALDLLYISARDELSDLMRPVPAGASPQKPGTCPVLSLSRHQRSGHTSTQKPRRRRTRSR